MTTEQLKILGIIEELKNENRTATLEDKIATMTGLVVSTAAALPEKGSKDEEFSRQTLFVFISIFADYMDHKKTFMGIVEGKA